MDGQADRLMDTQGRKHCLTTHVRDTEDQEIYTVVLGTDINLKFPPLFHNLRCNTASLHKYVHTAATLSETARNEGESIS